MISNKQAIFGISIIFNLIFTVFFCILIVKKGGISFLARQISFLLKVKVSEKIYLTPHYQLKQAQFEGIPNSEKEIIFLGDSLTEQGEWAYLLGYSNLKNRGISGDTTDGVLNRLDKIVASQPLKIFLMIGTNDIWLQNKDVDEIAKNYYEILKIIQEKTPNTEVFVQSILPVNNDKNLVKINNNDIAIANSKIKELARQFSFTYINLYDRFLNEQNQLDNKYTVDGVHLSGQGYLLWKEIIAEYVNK